MCYGTSPVGTAVRANSGPSKARQKMLETFVELLGIEPSIIQFQQIDILLDGFLWSAKSYAIVKKAAEDVHMEIHKEVAPWVGNEITRGTR